MPRKYKPRLSPEFSETFQQILLFLSLPAIVFPIELALPYPAFVEETAKLFSLLLTRWKPEEGKAYLPFAFGAVFGLSESLLHLGNAIQLGNLEPFLFRLILTVPMHALTMGILGVGVSSRRIWWIPVWIVAMTIHYLFNLGVGYGKWYW